MDERILYRLIDPHPIYGIAGRSYEYQAWKAFPWNQRDLFEKVNTGLTHYTYAEITKGHDTEYYLMDPDD